jgi:hypothetical protein
MRSAWTGSILCLLLAGCVNTGQLASDTEVIDFSLDTTHFHDEGLGFLTPVSATGQEADRVALAIAFADAVDESCDDLKVVRLAEVLSAVNRSGLAAEYKRMIDDYNATGILERETLRKVGMASDARYLGLLSLGRFSQQANKRFSIGGIRIIDTKQASIRLSLQIWDSETGAIAWEGSDEIHYAYDTGREKPVNLSFVAAKAAGNLIDTIPEPGLIAAAAVAAE